MISKIIEIAREAGEIIREGFGSNFQIDIKTGENNLVTEIDKKSEKTIIDFIKKDFPDHSILAEESGKDFRSGDFLWVIDPLDGTTNFAHGLPYFSVSIGLQRGEEIIAGVIYDVMLNRMYAAEKGSGTYCNDKKVFVSTNDKLERSLLVTGFPYDVEDQIDRAVDLFGEFVKRSRAVRRLGSAAIDMAYVAAGIFDGFWEEKLNPWDVCAGIILVEEAGGKISDYKGNKITIYDKQILATNNFVHNQMTEIINKSY